MNPTRQTPPRELSGVTGVRSDDTMRLSSREPNIININMNHKAKTRRKKYRQDRGDNPTLVGLTFQTQRTVGEPCSQ